MSEVEGMAQALVPFYTDGGKKSKYLSYIVSNFSVTEAAKLANVHLKTVREWRKADPRFEEIENRGLTDLRKQLSKELIDIEFTRNFRMVLQKDFNVLFKTVTGVTLSDREHQYLLQIRKHYTPQQLAMIKQILGEVTGADKEFDFTKLTLTIRREREEMQIKAE